MTRRSDHEGAYPPISEYAFLSDCHSAALVSRAGSIDWCCMPRMDGASVFGRLLDWRRGGFCSLAPASPEHLTSRSYVDGTMVLTTHFSIGSSQVRVHDCFTMHAGGRENPHRQLIRIIEGVQGRVEMRLRLVPRFDYGEIRPWLRRHSPHLFAAIGGANGLLIHFDRPLSLGLDHDLFSDFTIRARERIRLDLRWQRPEDIDQTAAEEHDHAELDRRLQETIDWWRDWLSRAKLAGPDAPGVFRSAVVLRALVNAPTGAIAAAATTSLPERIGGNRNWDYRFSWIRDSTLSVRALAEIGVEAEADGFRRFIQRSTAGSARDLQVMYGLGGERRLTELELPNLEGYKGSRPVRIGNKASEQLQLDCYGELMMLTWYWHRRGYSPDDDYWRFLVDVTETAIDRFPEPDHGVWEVRGRPLHFVFSKVVCWLAVDRGVALAKESLRQAPVRRWRRAAAAMRAEIEEKGYDARRGTFRQAYGGRDLDASLLLLPFSGFVEAGDERMVRTVDAIRRELDVNGLIRRYRTDRMRDGVGGGEGQFIACTFWMAEILARQGRIDEARDYFDRAAATGNDLGLFSEEYDSENGEMLGNFPQALTHLSHIAAAVALSEATPAAGAPV